MKKAIRHEDGTWFGIPLRNGGFGTGVIARHSPDGSILLAYLFGPKRKEVPSLAEVSKLSPQDALKVIRVGALGLVDGSWPTIGRVASWQREDWPMPQFVRRDDLSEKAWLVTYSDGDPNDVIEEQSVPFDITNVERDALHGAGAAEIVLTRLLS